MTASTFALVQTNDGLPDVLARGLTFDEAIRRADEIDPDYSLKVYAVPEENPDAECQRFPAEGEAS